MMATTTSNSISVKPWFRPVRTIDSSYVLVKAIGAGGAYERDTPLPGSGQRHLAVLVCKKATMMPNEISRRHGVINH
jgi:hypothetical protein